MSGSTRLLLGTLDIYIGGIVVGMASGLSWTLAAGIAIAAVGFWTVSQVETRP